MSNNNWKVLSGFTSHIGSSIAFVILHKGIPGTSKDEIKYVRYNIDKMMFLDPLPAELEEKENA